MLLAQDVNLLGAGTVNAAQSGADWVWIVKPPHLARGWDILITREVPCILRHLQASDRLSVSRYITNPDLYRGHKYDLRFYVLVRGHQVNTGQPPSPHGGRLACLIEIRYVPLSSAPFP